MPHTAGIILIGNELLSGKVVDVNAAYLCRQFRELGVDVRKVSVIPDEVDLIAREVREFHQAYTWVFTSGGVGPTHDDVTIEGVARGLGVGVVRHPVLVTRLEELYRDRLNDARLKMAEVPEGAELLAMDSLIVPVLLMENIFIFPGVPEIFRRKFDAIKERFRERPFLLRNVYVSIGEGTLADHLNAMLREFPALLCGSYPEFSNPEYKVRVTLESKEPEYLEGALRYLLGRLPLEAVVRIE
ncbi:MAG TPA: competence/damage-inducible protein A [Methylomirabilota bacterium]|jgi:molybdenum cofactor synthesis domain-containing protein|nr:competence/damage-inducible protein A [Methylomirabilota bacterium]